MYGGWNRRGMSAIIATLLIILLTLVAVGIIWVVVRNVIQSGAEQVSLGKFTLNLEIKSVVVDIVNNSLDVKIKRNPGEGKISGLNFIIEDDENTEVVETKISLKELEERTITLVLIPTINMSRIQKVSVAPIFLLESGKEVMGDVKDEYVVPACIPNCAGRVCGNNGCGGSCGSCLTGQTCNLIGQCTLSISGMVSWWKFDGNALDSIGTNHGTVNGATLINTGCKSVQCYSFNGTTDYIIAPINFDMGSGEFSISAWVYFNYVDPLMDQTIFTKRSPPTGTGSPGITFGIDIDGGELSLYTRNNTLNNLLANNTDSLTSEVLYHVVVTRSGSSARIYINGIDKTSSTSLASSGFLNSTGQDAYIGAHRYMQPPEIINAYMNGTIDELMIFNRSLSLTEVQNIYNYVYP